MADSPLSNADGPIGVKIQIDGSAISDTIDVLSVNTHAKLGAISDAVVALVGGSLAESSYLADDETFMEGGRIEVLAFYGSHPEQRLFEGIITGKRMRVNETHGVILEVMARDKATSLAGPEKMNAFEGMKDSEVISELIDHKGLTAALAATDDAARDQIQYQESDWDFLRRLAERNGQVVRVADGVVTTEAPDFEATPSLTLTMGTDIIAFDATVDAEHLISHAGGQVWDSTLQEAVGAEGKPLKDAKWGEPSPSKLAEVVNNTADGLGGAGAMDVARLKTLADARLLRSALSAIQGTCMFQGSGKVSPGKTVELTDLGKRFGGLAYVSSVKHQIDDGRWTTEVRMGLPEPTPRAAYGRLDGLQVGKVVQLSGDPDELLRIKVNLPLIGATGAQVWARYAQPYASSDAGINFQPEIDDEVFVAFLGGDPNAPVVVGSVKSPKWDEARAVEDERNNLKSIVTREGLKIEFDEDKKAITVSTPGGNSVVMDDSASEMSLKDMAGNSIVMGPEGITIDSVGRIDIKSTTALDVFAWADVTVKGANVSCDAETAVTVKGGASAELSADGVATVRATLVKIN